ncbi:MAG: thioredoxin-disulfide reductase [Lachnospiraceae bacterium]|nr:thioredoxin-disulfide reductase [Lachnospiraceae bacterium]
MYDLVIIGSGPAGMAAAVYAARAELSFVVLEKGVSGGQVLNTSDVDNYPGLPEISGFDLAEKFENHAKHCGAEIRMAEVTEFEKIDGGFRILLDFDDPVETRTILIATGAQPRRLGCEGEEEFAGMGVSYCATCDGAFFKNREVVVIGGGNTAVEDAIYLARGCSKVTIVHRRDTFRASKTLVTALRKTPNIEIAYDSVVDEILGEDAVTGVTLRNVRTGETRLVPAAGVFIAVGTNPVNLGWQNSIPCDPSGYFIAGENCATQIPGIYAAGDVRTKALRQIVTAAADGANAVYHIEQYLAELAAEE